jgi:DNA polymerase-3 subunit gamma/tau
MAHAQRLLPIEQLLSGITPKAASTRSGAVETKRKETFDIAAQAADISHTRHTAPPPSGSPSPFDADSARKNKLRSEAPGNVVAIATRSGSSATSVVMGSSAPALADLSPTLDPQAENIAIKAEVETEVRAEAKADSLRDAVLNALANQQMLVSLLENAEWSLNGNALIAKVAASNTMIEMSFTNEARRMATAAASGLAGRPIKMLVEPGGAPQPVSAARRSSSKSTGTARSRAEQDPIVQRMQEKFGAEIRTVIDYREKG